MKFRHTLKYITSWSYLLALDNTVTGMCAVMCWGDQNSHPNLEADTHLNHKPPLEHTQHSACASPEGIQEQME